MAPSKIPPRVVLILDKDEVQVVASCMEHRKEPTDSERTALTKLRQALDRIRRRPKENSDE
jgi:hypothetical protein